MGRLQRLRGYARRSGWPLALRQLALWALERGLGLRLHYVFRRAHVAEHRQDAALPGVVFRVLQADELARWAQDPRYDLAPAFVAEALARGDICLGALENGSLLGYTWWASAPKPQGEVWVSFPAGSNYGYKGFVLPEHRGRGIYEPLVMSGGDAFMRQGISHTVYLVAVSNLANLRVQDKVGVPRAGIAGYVRAFGRTITFRSPGAGRIGVRFVSAGRGVRTARGPRSAE